MTLTRRPHRCLGCVREKAGSFDSGASLFERYRAGPPVATPEWFVAPRVGRIIDLGAGTGALTGLLIDRADEVAAIELHVAWGWYLSAPRGERGREVGRHAVVSVVQVEPVR